MECSIDHHVAELQFVRLGKRHLHQLLAPHFHPLHHRAALDTVARTVPLHASRDVPDAVGTRGKGNLSYPPIDKASGVLRNGSTATLNSSSIAIDVCIRHHLNYHPVSRISISGRSQAKATIRGTIAAEQRMDVTKNRSKFSNVTMAKYA